MRRERWTVLVGVALAGGLVACGGGGSSSPTPVPAATPTPQPASTPTPTPTPEATTYPNGQPVVARVTIKIENVLTPDGNIREGWMPGDPIYVGDTIRLDATAKSKTNQPTTGSGASDPFWEWGPSDRFDLNYPYGFNPRGTCVSAGQITFFATLDGVTSDPLIFDISPVPGSGS